jgi:PHD/YefM family antitoxin component YafN of YafNO toxin-antitoxin module
MFLHIEEFSMTFTTLSSREFNQNTSGAKKAAADGPVFITDRGRVAHVLLTAADYHHLKGDDVSLLEALAQSPEGDFDFEAPRLNGPLHKQTDLA